MKGLKITFVIILLIAVTGAFTNPGEAQHKEALKASMRGGLSKALQNNGIQSSHSFFNAITDDLYDNYIWSSLLEKEVSRKNYGIFSTTRLSYLNKDYTAGIGIFGKVYIFPQVEQQVAERINRFIKEGGGLQHILNQ